MEKQERCNFIHSTEGKMGFFLCFQFLLFPLRERAFQLPVRWNEWNYGWSGIVVAWCLPLLYFLATTNKVHINEYGNKNKQSKKRKVLVCIYVLFLVKRRGLSREWKEGRRVVVIYTQYEPSQEKWLWIGECRVEKVSIYEF